MSTRLGGAVPAPTAANAVQLDHHVQTLVDEVNAGGPGEFSTFTPTVARQAFRRLQSALRGDEPRAVVGGIRDEEISARVDHGGRGHRVPVRVYEPIKGGHPPVVVVYLHGGGWVVGDLDTADHTARAISRGLSARVVSVDYRLAPEHPFPAAFNDARSVLEELTRTHPTARIGVIGDSAGGNLAAALALVSRHDPSVRVDAQLLFYPALDPTQSLPSHDKFADGFILTRTDMKDYWDKYLPTSSERADSRGAPFAAADLSDLPAAVVATAGFDPLRDEGQRYAERLVAAAVPTTYLPSPGLVHGWLDMTGRVPAARYVVDHALRVFACVLNTATTATAPRPGRFGSPNGEQLDLP